MTDDAKGGRKKTVKKKAPLPAIPGYEILRKLGEGAMGTVYLARQIAMDRRVALKILLPTLAKEHRFKERFFREARIVGKLRHPHIVAAYDAREEKGLCYLAMEYVEGIPLSVRLKAGERFSEEEALHIGRQIASALDHAAKAGLVHRDIKPENILYTADGTAKLCDLGIAKAPTDPSLTQSGISVGTPHYIAPEQIKGRALDIRTDLYSLGATLYHLLTGAPPFSGKTAAKIMLAHLKNPLPPLRSRVPEVSPDTAALIEKMMEKDPEKRPATPREVVEAIDRILAQKKAAATLSGRFFQLFTSPPSPEEKSSSLLQIPLRKAGVAAAGLGILLVGVAVLWKGGFIPFEGESPEKEVALEKTASPPSKEISIARPLSSDPSEVEARKAYILANELEDSGKKEEAMAHYRTIMETAPATRYAALAKEKVEAWEKERKRLVEEEAVRKQREEREAAARKEWEGLRTQSDLSDSERLAKLDQWLATWSDTTAGEEAKAERDRILRKIEEAAKPPPPPPPAETSPLASADQTLVGKDWERIETILHLVIEKGPAAGRLTPMIQELARSASPSKIRALALAALIAAAPEDVATEAARKQLRDRNEAVRLGAIAWLKKKKDIPSRALLAELAKEDPSPTVRKAARIEAE